MTGFLLVAVGGALGAVLRYALTRACVEYIGSEAYLATLVINITGSFLLGLTAAFLVALPAGHIAGTHLRPLLVIGVLGGFTTFSTFSLEVLAMLHGGNPVLALVYVCLSVILSLGAAAAGYWLHGAL